MADKTHKLYNGDVTIHFKDSNHSYWIEENGKKRRLAGVTTFIKIMDKPALVRWAVRTTVEYIRENLEELQNDPHQILQNAKEESDRQKDLAAEIGSAIHGWIEDHINGDNPEMPEDERVLQGVVHFLDWVSEHKVKFISSEQIVYSRTFDYVGTLDIIAEVDGELCLIDIKTGNGIYAEVKMQTAAYRSAWQEEQKQELSGRWVWRISKETEEQYVERMNKKGKTDFAPFKPFEAVYLDIEADAQENDFKGFLWTQKLYRWRARAQKELRS